MLYDLSGMDEIKVKQLKNPSLKVGDIDTASPFESVNEAVSMFGSIVNRKAHKLQTTDQKHVHVEQVENINDEIALMNNKFDAEEEAKLQVFKELDGTKRLIEELTLNLKRAETEEHEAKQDSELVAAAVAELATVRNKLESLHKDYGLLVSEKDVAVKRAREAASSSKDVEKHVESLTIQLMMTKEYLESANAAYLAAEEHRIEAVIEHEQDALKWKQELKQAQEELEKVKQQINAAEYQKSKLDTATSLLHDLQTELAAYKESNLSRKKNVEAVKENITKAIEEIDYLKTTANSLKIEVEREKAALAATRRRQGMAAAAVASLEAELNQTRLEIACVRSKEKETREQVADLPKRLQKAAREADQAKSRAQEARDDVKKAKETVEQIKALEKLALAGIDARQRREKRPEHEQEAGVTVSLEEYYELSKKAREAEEAAQSRVDKVISLIDVAKESESKSLSQLEQLTLELAARKQAFDAALQKAEKANQRKLGVEQDLRNWRVEQGQRRKSGLGVGPREGFEEVKRFNVRPVSPLSQNSRPVFKTDEWSPETGSLKKNESVFPRAFMALRNKET